MSANELTANFPAADFVLTPDIAERIKHHQQTGISLQNITESFLNTQVPQPRLKKFAF